MFYYRRKTGFIDYYINGIKSRSIGIVKQKLEDDRFVLLMEIMDLKEQRDCLCKVSVGDGQRGEKLTDVHICNGQGNSVVEILRGEWKAKFYKKLLFDFGNDCYGVADIMELPESEQEEEEVLTMEDEGESEEEIDVIIQNKDIEEPTDFVEEHGAEVLAECLELQPDKWEVIKKKYPILYPFKGQGPYVSIKPVDLQLLNPKYHNLNNNSYLMHAFYQYRHMILGEYEQEKGTFFYVGVPGEFVKKEQTSAAMFGFEGYEHSGNLGYYLYRVEL